MLLDQTGLAPEAVAGNVKTRIVQLLMMAAFGHWAPEALRLAAELASLPEASGESTMDLFLSYLTRTQESEGIDTFKETMQHHGIDIGGKLMTYAEQLLAEGEAKGEQRGEQRTKVEIVEGLLRVGVAWDVIEAATGLTEAGFREIKAQLPGSGS